MTYAIIFERIPNCEFVDFICENLFDNIVNHGSRISCMSSEIRRSRGLRRLPSGFYEAGLGLCVGTNYRGSKRSHKTNPKA